MDFDKAIEVTTRVHATGPSIVSVKPQYQIVMRESVYKQIVNYWGDFADYLHSIDSEPEDSVVEIRLTPEEMAGGEWRNSQWLKKKFGINLE